MMTPKIYIAQDPVLEEVLDTATDRLRAEGWEVVSISSSEFANVGHTVFLKRETTATGSTA